MDTGFQLFSKRLCIACLPLGFKSLVPIPANLLGGAGGSLGALSDIDVSGGLSNGMVLVYNASTSKWDATLSLTPGTTQNLDINGGNF